MRLPLGIMLLHCVEVTSQSEKGKISCSKEGGVLPIGRLLFLNLTLLFLSFCAGTLACWWDQACNIHQQWGQTLTIWFSTVVE
jgi:hypothetical protein